MISQVALIEPADYLIMADFAKELGISKQAIFEAIERGKIKLVVRIGRTVLIHKEELKKYNKK